MGMQRLLNLLLKASKESSLSADDKALLLRLISILETAPEIGIEDLYQCITKFKPTEANQAKKKSTKAVHTDTAEVERLKQLLESQWHDPATMQSLISEIKANKSVRTQEVSELVSKIRGSNVKVKNKAEGIKEIETWYTRRRETQRRLSRTEDIY